MPQSPVRPSRAGIVPWPDEVVARYVAKGYWEGLPLAAHVFSIADATPDVVALVDGDVRLTYRQLADRADGVAMRMSDLGLRPDDRILVQLPNCWEFVVLTLACLRLGVIPVMALTAHRRHELTYLADRAEARAIAVPGAVEQFDHQAAAHAIAADTPSLEHVLVAGGEIRPGGVDLRALCRPAVDSAGTRHALDSAAPVSRSVALMLLSGGTSGLPKLIARAHDDYGCYVGRAAEVCGYDSGTVYLAVLPLAHSMTLGTALAVLRTGGRVVISSSPSPAQSLATIEREQVTATAVVPAIAQRWLAYRESDAGHDLSSMRLLLVGGARLADEIAARIVPALTRTLQQGYGMAEGLVCLTRPDDPDEVTWRTQGRPICADDELVLVDDNDAPVGPDESGMLLTRGPCTPRGYYRAEDYNSHAFVGDGWLRTGDIVRRRPDGNVVVEGRVKDMINRGGEKVSAEEVENFAYQVPGVRQTAAVSMPDSDLGERICLYVVPGPGATVALEDVHAVMVRDGAAPFKMPERLVLLDTLPTTNIGKIDKKALRADIAERLAAERAVTAPAATQIPVM